MGSSGKSAKDLETISEAQKALCYKPVFKLAPHGRQSVEEMTTDSCGTAGGRDCARYSLGAAPGLLATPLYFSKSREAFPNGSCQ